MDLSGNPVGHTAPETDPQLLEKLQADLGEDFLVERELGRGGMAVVYLARDVHIGRRVAVKVLPPELSFTHGSGFVDRFKREARTAGSLEHPHIIPIHRVSTDGKLHWYIMKFVEGESLDHVLKREGQLSMRKTSDILTAAADALDYAHKRNVIHRDIKPGNVLIDTEGKVTITDFGIAKAFLGESLTVSGSILGTPYYMSPEQCAGKQLTGAADQYSLAIMAYQMLSGHVPFQGESAVEIIKKHTLDPPPPITVLRPGVPGPASAALEKALAKSPEDRFPSARDFVRAFERSSEENTSPLSVQDVEITKRATEKLAQMPDVVAMPTQATPYPLFKAPLKEWGYAIRSRLTQVRRWLAHQGHRVEPLMAKLEPVWVKLAPVRARLAPVLSPVQAKWRGLDARVRRFAAAAVVAALVFAALPSRAARQARADSIAADSAAAVASAVAAAKRDSLAALARRNAELHSVLRLRVRPADATVLVDGTPATGDTIRISAGKHVVSVTKQGYRPFTDSFTAREKETVTRTATLLALPAKLTLSTSIADPKAVVKLLVNNNPVKNPANNIEVAAGNVKVRFMVNDAKGAWGQESTFTVAPGATVTRKFTLARPSAEAVAAAALGKLTLSSNVAATFSINGAAVPNPVKDFAVQAGLVRIHISAKTASGGTWEADSALQVPAGRTVRKQFTLKPVDVAAAPVSAPANVSSGPRRPRPPRVPAGLPATVVSVPGQSKTQTLASGWFDGDNNLLSPSCVKFAELFWDVMGYDVDLARICRAPVILAISGSPPLLNFTRFTRTKDGAIEAVERPSEVGEWRNEATGKLLHFRVRGDSIAVIDETKDVPLVRLTTRRASRSATVRPPDAQGVSVARIEGFGVAVKTPRDSLPVAGLATHPHRIGGCDGQLSFDGETFRFVPVRSNDAFQFTVADILSGVADSQRGTLRVRARGGTERLALRDWSSIFEAIIVARME